MAEPALSQAPSPRRPISDEMSETLADFESSMSASSAASMASVTSVQRASFVRIVSLCAAVVTALCANSISVFSLYAPLFQSRLRYTQLQINGVAIGFSIALYFLVPFLGYVCDRFGSSILSLLAAVLFCFGYGIAALIYNLVDETNRGVGKSVGQDLSWSYPVMVICFVAIGVATCAMYLSSIATTAKNFGKGKYRGLALALPIASFGLSGMWISQVGSRLLCERDEDGHCVNVDVRQFFAFLAFLTLVIGLAGIYLLRVVNEEDLIEEAVDELERSGVLEGSAILSRRSSNYGTIAHPGSPRDEEASPLLARRKSVDAETPEDFWWKKVALLNAETREFVTDPTMWFLALGFFLMIGPGETFINNMGTIIGTLSTPTALVTGSHTSPATHVTILAFTSTVSRILVGSLTDILAPSPDTDHPQVAGSVHSIRRGRYSISRVAFLLFFAGLSALGLVTLASGFVQEHDERFWIVTSLVGAGYGAIFSLTPIIITVIWGVENFGTNWGIVAMFPAIGSIVWGLIYSTVYENGAKQAAAPGGVDGGNKEIFCYGEQCYAPTFWGMTASTLFACGMVLWAWQGPNGWARRGVVV